MHPEILRELSLQRGREMRAQAHQAMLGRMASRARRASRRRHRAPGEADGFIMPAIPDYVDGSYRAAPVDEPAGRPGRVPAGDRAD